MLDNFFCYKTFCVGSGKQIIFYVHKLKRQIELSAVYNSDIHNTAFRSENSNVVSNNNP